MQEVRRENIRLKNKLYSLNRQTHDLKESLENIKEDNYQIKKIINDSGISRIEQTEKTSIKNYNNISHSELDEINMDTMVLKEGISINNLLNNNLINSSRSHLEFIERGLSEKKNSIYNLQVEAREYVDKRKYTPSIWPVQDEGEGYISSGFGWRNHPITKERDFHTGLDIAVWYETPVKATANGTVTYSDWRSGYGWTVDIKHDFGYSTRYAHLREMKVSEGEQVKQGDIIALSGSTGQSTGPHLHYEVRLDDEPKNPENYLGGRK